MTTLAIATNPHILDLNVANKPHQPQKRITQVIHIVAIVALALVATAFAAIGGLLISGIAAAIISGVAAAAVATLSAILYKVVVSRQTPKAEQKALVSTTPASPAHPETYNVDWVSFWTSKFKSMTRNLLYDFGCTVTEEIKWQPTGEPELDSVKREIIAYIRERQDSVGLRVLPTHNAIFDKCNNEFNILVTSYFILEAEKELSQQNAKSVVNNKIVNGLKSELEHFKSKLDCLMEEDLRLQKQNSFGIPFLNSICYDNFSFLPLVPIWAKYSQNLAAQEQSFGKTPLMANVDRGRNAYVAELLRQVQHCKYPKDFINIQDKFGMTALHYVAGKAAHKSKVPSNAELAEQLIRMGASQVIQNKEGNTPLHIAALRRNLEMIQSLVTVNQDPNLLRIKNNSGQAPVDLLKLSFEEAKQILLAMGIAFLDKKEFEDQNNLIEVEKYIKI